MIPDGPRRRPAARPRWMLAAAFAAAIFVGALLLMLPAAQAGGGPRLSFLDALFTATSATCVTGLTVVDTATRFTLFGQVVILGLIQLGGLGIMTFGTFLLVLAGSRPSVRSESVLLTALGAGDGAAPSLRPLLLRTVFLTFVIEGCGATLLTWRHLLAGLSPARAAFLGVFHAVSAFCNAGFALFPGGASLTAVSGDRVYLLTVAALIAIGGLGFLVLHNLGRFRFWRRSRKARGRITIHTHMVLAATLVLTLGGWLALLALEWHASLEGLDAADKWLAAFFQSVAARTAGFNSVPLTRLSEPGRLLTMGLMFVGGAPGSTAGGVKTTTMVVLALTVVAMLRGRRETLYRRRAIPEAVVREAIVIFLLSLFFVTGAFGALLLTATPNAGGANSLPLLFETVSAFGTVGLSLGMTPALSRAGRAIIIAAMFVGRLGPLTLALVVGRPAAGGRVRYPEEEVVVG